MKHHNRSRLRLEALETRTLLTGDVFGTLTSFVTNPDGLLDTVRQQLEAAAPDHLVPLIGAALDPAADYLEQARDRLHDALGALGLNDGIEQVQIAIVNALGDGPGGLDILGDRSGDGDITVDDVQINILDHEGGLIDIYLDLEKDLQTATPDTVDFDLGLPALPFYVSSESVVVEASFGFEYRNFHFGVNAGGAFLDLDSNDTGADLIFQATAGLDQDFSIEGALGFIHGRISAAEELTGVSAQIGIDFAGGGAPSIDVSGSAEVNLLLEAELIGDVFPGVSTVLHIEWNGDDPGAAPTVEFQNISVEFSSRFLAPVVEHLEPILDAAGWVVEKLDAPIPVLSDLAEGVGFDPISVLNVLDLAGDLETLPLEYRAIAKGIVTVADIIDILDGFGAEDNGTFALNFGSFQVAGDARNPLLVAGGIDDFLSDSPLSQLAIDPSSFTLGSFDLDGVRKQLDKLAADGYLPTSLHTNLNALLDQLENGVQFSFPLLENPAQALFPLLLGQDTNLFQLEAHFRPLEDYANSFGTPLGVDVSIGGEFQLALDLEFGFDTHGLRRFLSDTFQGEFAEPLDVLGGFYFGEDTAFSLLVGVKASAGVNAVLFHADVTGSILGDLNIAVPPEAIDGDGKARLRLDLLDSLFTVSGGVTGSLTASVGVGVEIPFGNFLGVEKEWVLAERDLVRFNFSSVPNPWNPEITQEPALATRLPDGTLRLNIGLDSVDRNHESGITDEVYTVVASTPRPDDPSGLAVNVYFDGQSERFTGVTAIAGDAATGNDIIYVELGEAGAGVTVTIQGGIGHDTLHVEGGSVIILAGGDGADDLYTLTAGTVLLTGGAGNDVLTSGAGDDSLTAAGAVSAFLAGHEGDDVLTYEGTGTALLFGGQNDDALHGGDGANSLYGEGGSDELHGGDGDNYLEGGAGHDDLYGGDGSNELHGNDGDDTLIAGPNGDVLFGGNGNDSYLAGAGDDIIHVTESQFNTIEMISWEYEDGNTEIDAPNGDGLNGLFVALEVLGSPGDDFFRVSDGAPGTVQIEAPDGKLITGSGLDDISVDGRDGEDHIIIESLNPFQDVDRIGVNLNDNLDNDGVVDLVEVRGSDTADDDLVIDQDQVVLAAYKPGAERYPASLRWGGVMTISGLPNYTVFVMNTADDLQVQTFAGDDTVQVNSVTGPTLVDTGSGNDVIQVSALTGGEPGFVGPDGPIPPDYAAELVVEAGAGSNSLTVEESQNPDAEAFTVTHNRITSLLLPGVHYQATGGDFGQVTIYGTAQADVFQVQSTAASVAETRVHGWDGDDKFEVGVAAGRLSDLNGALRVTAGPTGGSTASLSDRTAASGNTNVLFTGDTVSGLAGPTDNVPLRFDTWGGALLVAVEGSESAALAEHFTLEAFLRPVQIEGRAGSETFEVRGLTLTAAATLHGAEGDDVYTVGDLGLLAATLTVSDPLGANLIAVDDSAAVGGRIYELTSSALNLLATAHDEIVLSGTVGNFSLVATDFGDQFRALGVPGPLAVQVHLSAGSNVLVGPDAATSWSIDGPNQVTVGDYGTFHRAINLLGGSAADQFVFGAGGQLTGQLVGGAGTDTLNYSALATGVTVDLAAGTATNVGGSVAQVEDVTGGGGDDVLLGDGGSNTLNGGGGSDLILGRAGVDAVFGGAGRDLLIGGLGADQVVGGLGEDLLIGGATTYDGDLNALNAVLSVWRNEALDYASRVGNLRAGTLTAATVPNDGAVDHLVGQGDLDWFWAYAGDTLDRALGEAVR